jgi:beta-aspartyl-peptidase (threonine type)
LRKPKATQTRSKRASLNGNCSASQTVVGFADALMVAHLGATALAATSTGGLTGKRYGRVGDTPLIGAGTYANGQVAVSCTGIGEEFIRHGIARDVAARVQHASASLRAAADAVIGTVLRPGSGGLIAVDASGQIVVSFNTEAMYRGAATAAGRFEVGLFPGECQ